LKSSDYYKKALRLYPDNFLCMLRLANSLSEAQKYMQAIGVYSLYLHHNQLKEYVWLQRGYNYFLIGANDKAISDFESAYEINNKNFETCKILVNGYISSGDTIEGFEVINDYIARAKRELATADSLIQNEKTATNEASQDKAYSYFNKSLEHAIAQAYNFRGTLHAEAERYNMALSDYEEGLSYSDNLNGMLGRMIIKYNLGQYRNAIIACDQILLKQETEPNALYYRGRSLIEIGDVSEGMSYIRQAEKQGYKLAVQYLNQMK
ncbi:MAG: hypothetical protein R3345_11735, partial [Fulvivirga sp.]|nr:hypothetical protein [Fulvivirga sp.]